MLNSLKAKTTKSPIFADAFTFTINFTNHEFFS